jgi:hypothetical protein
MFLDVWTPLTTVSKIILHKLYKILKTQKNHKFSRGFLPSFVLFVSNFGS